MAFTPITTDTNAKMPTATSEGFTPIETKSAGIPKKKNAYQKTSDFLGDVGVGIVKKAGSVAKGLGTAGQWIAEQTSGRVANAILGKGFVRTKENNIFTPRSEKAMKAEEWLKPKGTGEKIGSFVGEAALFLAPGGRIASFERALASKAPGAVTRFLPEMNATATKIITKATQLGIRSATEGLSNYGIARLSGLGKEESKGIGKFAAVIPGIGFGLNALRKPVSKLLATGSEQIVNSLVKPLLKDLSYGKNPARGILREGITANSMEDLATKVAGAQDTIGQEIGTINEIVSGRVTFDANRALTYIDSAIEQAAKSNDTTVFNRLSEIKKALTQNLGAEGGQIVSQGAKDLSNISADEMFNLKKTIGNMTKFTGNPSDDKAVNSVLKRTYGKLKEMYNAGVSKIDPKLGKKINELNERYADMTSAKVAIEHRALLDKRANLVSWAGHLGLAGSVVAGLATGDFSIVVYGLLSELAAKGAGSTAVKSKVAQFLAGLAESDRAKIFQKSTTLKRIFGEYSPIAEKEVPTPSADVPGVYKAGERYPQLPAPTPGAPRSSSAMPPGISVPKGKEYVGPGIATPPK